MFVVLVKGALFIVISIYYLALSCGGSNIRICKKGSRMLDSERRCPQGSSTIVDDKKSLEIVLFEADIMNYEHLFQNEN